MSEASKLDDLLLYCIYSLGGSSWWDPGLFSIPSALDSYEPVATAAAASGETDAGADEENRFDETHHNRQAPVRESIATSTIDQELGDIIGKENEGTDPTLALLHQLLCQQQINLQQGLKTNQQLRPSSGQSADTWDSLTTNEVRSSLNATGISRPHSAAQSDDGSSAAAVVVASLAAAYEQYQKQFAAVMAESVSLLLGVMIVMMMTMVIGMLTMVVFLFQTSHRRGRHRRFAPRRTSSKFCFIALWCYLSNNLTNHWLSIIVFFTTILNRCAQVIWKLEAKARCSGLSVSVVP